MSHPRGTLQTEQIQLGGTLKKFALGINEAARATGTSPQVIAEAIAARELIAVQLDGKPKIPRRALCRWLESLPRWYPDAT